MLAGKTVVAGITGGIAAFKAAQLVSSLHQQGAAVHVVMTSAAREFVTPLTFNILSGNPVHTDLFAPSPEGTVRHIDLAANADLVVVVPATANIIGKVACGIADDLLSTVVMAATCPVLFCPAMNVNMYRNKVVQRNIALLRDLGYHFVEPGSGRLACGTGGRGRLAEPEDILEGIVSLLTAKDLRGLTVMVTAGPTAESVDPVRFLTNRSSGKMGYALARAAARRGAKVILVSGPAALKPPGGVEFVPVETARQMYEAVLDRFEQVDAVIKAAAVADYRPKETAGRKIKKTGETLTLELERNPDILAELGRRKTNQVLIGFAAETHDLEQNARLKVAAKNLDFLVANDVTLPGAGFGTDTNIVKLVYPDGSVKALPQMDKLAVAHRILDEMLNVLKGERK
ncbi:MAG: bifunctional phosphopantothenoylcysteine decarboxylase/phosphopantothenate--cysteine ligase CoaBC [Firmicutes bacterium]|nr:bifunctional phosphopantothenoylcysteine decarboxylase/phosphopantothenate--cysteine ligase CoaBC [Bacillota bacterium]